MCNDILSMLSNSHHFFCGDKESLSGGAEKTELNQVGRMGWKTEQRKIALFIFLDLTG